MDILNPYYSDYSAVETCEELFLVFCRDLLALQGDKDKNQSNLDYIDITTNEDNKHSQIEIRQVLCSIAGDLIFTNLFTEDAIATDTTDNFQTPWPFGQSSLLGALCNLGVFLADEELKKDSFAQGKKIFSYSFTSNRNLGEDPMLFSLSARDFPLEYQSGGAWQLTKAKSWLVGSI